MSDSGPPAGSFDNWAFPPPPPSWPSAPQVPPPRRTSRALTLVVAIIATVLIGAVGGVAVAFATRAHQPSPAPGSSLPPGSTSPTSPATAQASALYQRALITTRGSSGFAYVSVSSGPQSEIIAGVAGQLGGRQVITFDSSYGAEHFTLLLVGATVYFQGNTPAVEDQLGVAVAHASALAGKWVSVVSGNGPYRVLQPGITVADQAQEMPLVPSRLASLTTTGAPATRILGSIPTQAGASEPAHLDVITASAIPLSYVQSFTTNGTTATTTTTFSQWGTAPSVSAPAGAVAWSTLVTSTPPGGYGNGGATSPSPSPTAQPAI
jgi:hypothetical protein